MTSHELPITHAQQVSELELMLIFKRVLSSERNVTQVTLAAHWGRQGALDMQSNLHK